MIKLITLLFAFILMGIVLEFVRKEKLTFKYAFGWLFVSFLGMFFVIFDKILFQLAGFLGFELPSNFIFFSLLGVFVVITFMMTVFLCQQNKRNDKMAQKIGLLELEIQKLKQNKDKSL